MVHFCRDEQNARVVASHLTDTLTFAQFQPSGFTMICPSDQEKLKNLLYQGIGWANNNSYAAIGKNHLSIQDDRIIDELA